MKKNVKLHVEDLTVSFRTTQGMVRAVRGVDFDLYEGETLAIVGESGSGKSVTSRAIMGILAGNGVIDDGKIIYEDQDLTKIDEEHFHELRGNRIGMIFQDPMSSLNPIMRIGKQITEGMILNGKRLENKYKKLIHLERMEVKNSVKAVKDIKAQLKADLAKVKAGESNETAQALKDRAKADIKVNKERISKAKITLKAAKVNAKAVVAKDWADEKAKTMKDIEGVKAKIDPAHIAKLVAEEQAKLEKVYEEYEQYKTEVLPTLSHEQRSYKKYEFQDKIRNQKQAIKDAKNFYNIKIEALKERLRRFKAVTQLEAFERAVEVMTEVGIDHPEKRFRQYPFQFSGGMRQRIVIAIALTASPEVLICDEPTTALDVTIQAQILELINDLKRERNLSVIFITHDLGVVANMADRIGVMYAGKIVEIGTNEDVFYGPRHPYTWALLSSMPDLTSKERLDSIPGTPPNMLFPPKGDAFADRSKFAMAIDFEEQPPMFKISDTHYAATWLLHKDAPEVPVPSVITDRIERMRTFVQEVKIDG